MNTASANISISILLIFWTIEKICDNIDFLIWKREVYEILKWIHFWKYIKSEIISTNIIFVDYVKWIENNDNRRTAFRTCVKENLYLNIKDFFTVKEVWKIIIKICILKSSNVLMTSFIKFEILKVDNCVIINKYDIKFRNIVNELFIYSEKFKININWLIYKYLADLFDFVRSFIDRWIDEHDLFKKDDILKHQLIDVIHDYEIQCRNLFDIAMIVNELALFF